MGIDGTGFASIAFGYPTHFGENPNPRQSRKERSEMFFAGMALGAVAGAAFGIGMMCCVVAGKQEDQQMEQMGRRQKEGEPKTIHFQRSGRDREVLPFGWGKPLHDGRGRNERDWICRFVDGKQVDVNGQVWEIGEFLWQMERRGDSGVSLRDSRKEGKVGGRMRKRNHVVPVRLNAKELRHLDGQVAKSGLSREEFLRSLILGAQLQTKPCEHHAELLRKIAGLCNNANQLAHVANGTGMAGEASVQEMLRISKETWRLVKRNGRWHIPASSPSTAWTVPLIM